MVIETYLRLARELNQVLEVITQPYCSNYCPNPPRGCCTAPFRKVQTGSEDLGPFQRIEAVVNGWSFTVAEKCCYHDDQKGCYLKKAKSPLCLGFLCYDLERFLENRYGQSQTQDFIDYMNALRVSTLQRPVNLFHHLSEAIRFGKKLVRLNDLLQPNHV